MKTPVAPSPARHLPSELALLLALVLIAVPFVFTTHYAADEFLLLSQGARMHWGEVIYRDFFEFSTPLSRWLLAGAFAITGPSMLAARVVQMALLVVAGHQAYHIARRLGVTPWLATVPGLLLLLAFHRIFPGYSHHWVVFPFLLGTVLAALRGFDTGRRRWWGLSGGFWALTFLTMQSDAMVLGAGLAGWLALLPLLGHGHWRQAAWRLGWIVVGAALPLGVAALYLLAHGALGTAWFHTMVWPFQQYKQVGGTNDVRYFTDLGEYVATNTRVWINMPFWYGKVYHVLFLLLLLPLAAAYAVAWGLGQFWARLAHRRALDPAAARLGLIALLAVGFFLLTLRGRADVPHAAYYAMPAALLATTLAQRWKAALAGPEHLILRQLPIMALALFMLTGVGLQCVGMAVSPTVWLRLESPDQRIGRAPIFEFLRSHTTPEDRLVSLPAGGLHYFYGRPPATRYSLVLPPEWGYNKESQYREVWEEIHRHRPKYVLATGLWGRGVGLSSTMRYPLEGYQLLPETFETPAAHGGGVKTYIYERIDEAEGARK